MLFPWYEEAKKVDDQVAWFGQARKAFRETREQAFRGTWLSLGSCEWAALDLLPVELYFPISQSACHSVTGTRGKTVTACGAYQTTAQASNAWNLQMRVSSYSKS
jgi:hypothetical protein